MLPRAVRLASVRGVEVRVDPWVLPLVVLLTWSVARRSAPVLGAGVAAAVGLATAIGLLGSILVHELAHALEGRHRGYRVGGVTLFLLGGATELHDRGHGPRDHLAVALVGPWASLACAAAAGIVATAAGQWLPSAIGVPLGIVAGTLGWSNLALAAFNLLPAAPLDGGRVLRAVLWRALGDRGRASRITTALGLLLGALTVVVAAALVTLRPDALVTALWTAVVGVFLADAAARERRQEALREVLAGTTVAALLGRATGIVPADATVAEVEGLLATRDAAGTSRHVALARDGAIVGALPVAALGDLHVADRAVRRAIDLARPLDDLPRVARDATGTDLVDALARSDLVVLTTDGAVEDVVDRVTVLAAMRHLRTGRRRGRSA